MEGTVPGKRVEQFRDQLKEGSIYTTENFDLYDPRKSYRSVDHPFPIFFTMRTCVSFVFFGKVCFVLWQFNYYVQIYRCCRTG
jgi:hypothetical protein